MWLLISGSPPRRYFGVEINDGSDFKSEINVLIEQPRNEPHRQGERPHIGHVTLDFVTDETDLVVQTLAARNVCSERYKDDIKAFQEHARSLSAQLAEYIQGQPASLRSPQAEDPRKEKAMCFIETLRRSNAFNTVRQQTAEFKEDVERQWRQNVPLTSRVIGTITGTNPPDQTFTVLITHPSLNQGMYLHDKCIMWGCEDRWDNYSTVYLWHEIFHELLGKSDISHAIIELITDNELRVQLNGGSYPPYEGHPQLSPLRGKIHPYWTEYLKSDPRNIFVFEQKMLDIFKSEAQSSVW